MCNADGRERREKLHTSCTPSKRKTRKREDAIHEEKNVSVADGRSGTDQQHDAYRLRRGSGDDRKIVRIGHVQSQTHPDHLGLEAFANYINEKLGDKYRVEVYPSELLGSQTEMVQLTQTGAIDFVVASTAIMETSVPNTKSSTCLTCSPA